MILGADRVEDRAGVAVEGCEVRGRGGIDGVIEAIPSCKKADAFLEGESLARVVLPGEDRLGVGEAVMLIGRAG